MLLKVYSYIIIISKTVTNFQIKRHCGDGGEVKNDTNTGEDDDLR
jgi:hypothetical protein